MGTCALDTGADFTSKPAHEKYIFGINTRSGLKLRAGP